ncbi:TetR/AcrR family transcriptional regulator [Thalassococcus sp. S3]|uniref:TetR/AcrR family transcriptional regulator n=1 Tax=Thalassococcus sp. S3 TaxID=2017482 RepID=UPI0010242EE6|nr:TetR/AcrR family transcriptional regulator [Thalassococcus sp. S3]QBF31553.1 hypothetical protein CFI11_10035 [Thalassococcus sp. S3]
MKRFARIDWLDLALRQLSAEGPDALRLEAICDAAGRTKGSFYHHFKDHDAFLEDVVAHWTARQTTELLEDYPLDQIGEAEMEEMFHRVLDLDFDLERAIRRLGNSVPALQDRIRETDATRLTFSRKAYQARYGMSEEVARDMAVLDYAAFAGLLLVFPDMTKERQIEVYRTFETLLNQAIEGPQK